MNGGWPRLLLASASPRRQKLLAEAGFELEVVVPRAAEISAGTFTLFEATAWNALHKGLVVARVHPGAVVLAADTLVELEGRVIGKPADRAAAVRILRRLGGQTHVVATSVFITHLRHGQSENFTASSRVIFKKLSERMIEDYLARIDPLDKAGAYAAQGEGSAIIEKIIGSRSNVIGLPMAETNVALARFGIAPAAPNA